MDDGNAGLRPVHWESLARELVRALRGSRSQLALSRRLGYRSNAVHAWEGGRRAPTASEALRTASRVGIDVRAAIARFLGQSPPWLAGADPASAAFVARLLGELRAGAAIGGVGGVAERCGASRFAVSRFLSGRAEPRLPQFLALVEALSNRVVDLLAELVDPEALPSVRRRWRDLERRRRLAIAHPWAQAVMRTLETVAYRGLPAHRPGWIAAQLGVAVEIEARCLDALERAGLVAWDGSRYAPVGAGQLVDTRRLPEVSRGLKRHWAEVGVERLARGDEGLWSYNVFNVSRADLVRLQELHVEYFRSLRRVIAASEPLECVVVANVQLFELVGGAGYAEVLPERATIAVPAQEQ